MTTIEDQARSIFLAALEHAPDEWPAFLEQACGDIADMRARVDQLLQAHQALGSIHCGARASTTTIDEALREAPGTFIGPYKLMEQIGEGGMGLVFVAEQQQPVRRKVAVKVIKPGMDTRQVVARFEAERQALALMDHPNIAKVLDGGETASGRPYFVMELVRGVPITEYCDENQVPVRDRMELFLQVCQAVQHAHQKGIIHRDIKPSNVLVTSRDGTPVPKVIDFGVAKAVGQQLTDKTIYTQFMQLVGTPLYMSPEQAGQSNLDVDTRTDIYALGVLLYELLTGTTPFAKERFKEVGYEEIRRIIREEEPPKPSTRISTLGKAATTHSTRRKSDPKRLSQLCRGELDWIVMKALEKDRDRRYETANAFAADVKRYLNDEAVLACPPSAAYRVRKFVRRNKSALAVTGLVLFFIVLLGSGGGWAFRDRQAREDAVSKERRDRETRLMERVEKILDEVDQLARARKWPEALAAAKRAEAALADGDAGDAIQKRVADTRRYAAFVDRLDRIRHDSADFDDPKHNHRRAARDSALAFREYGVDVDAMPSEEVVARFATNPALAVAVAAALDNWAEDCRVPSKEGAVRWQPLVVIARGLDPDPLRDRLRAVWGQPITPELQADLQRLADAFDVEAQSPATVELLARTLIQFDMPEPAIRILRDGQYAYPADFSLAASLGMELYLRKDDSGAVRYDSTAVSLRPDSAFALTNLGVDLIGQKKLDEAIACCRRAIAIDRNYALAHGNLGKALADKGMLTEAIACYRKAIELDPQYVMAHSNLGAALGAQGKRDDAIECFQKAIELDPEFAPARNNLGIVLIQQNKLDKAIECFQKAIELNPKYVIALSNLGTSFTDKGMLPQAIDCFERAIALDHEWAPAYYNLSRALVAQKKMDEAIGCYSKAIELDPKDVDAHVGLGLALRDKNDLEGGIREFKAALKIDPNNFHAHNNLGDALHENGQFEEAVAEFREALRIKKNDALVQNKLRDAEQLAVLAKRLQAIQKDNDDPKDSAEHIALAWLCQRYRKEYVAGIRFYEQAFAAEPKLVASNRYNAACAAALAGCGQGKDAGKLHDQERGRLRSLALDWLLADLEANHSILEKDGSKASPTVAGLMRHWLDDPDLAGVRDLTALAELPETERQAWQKLWNDVADLQKRAKDKAASNKK
jgi:serine/threonine protein kinase/Tfp pilus assembly protein PilF